MRSGSATELFFACVPTAALPPSNRITEGVIRSLSALGMIWGFPYASICATAEKVVPRSIPIALRVDILWVAGTADRQEDGAALVIGADSMPETAQISRGTRTATRCTNSRVCGD